MPSDAAIRPFQTLPPTTADMKARDKMIKAAFSGKSRNCSTRMARNGAAVKSTKSENVSPVTEDIWATRSAFPACPFCVMG